MNKETVFDTRIVETGNHRNLDYELQLKVKQIAPTLSNKALQEIVQKYTELSELLHNLHNNS